MGYSQNFFMTSVQVKVLKIIQCSSNDQVPLDTKRRCQQEFFRGVEIFWPYQCGGGGVKTPKRTTQP